MKYQKSPQADATVKNQQAKTNIVKIYMQNYLNNYYLTEKPTRKGHTTTKRNSRNEEYNAVNREHVENPDD